MSLPFFKHLEWLCLEGTKLKDIQSFYDNIQLPIPTEDDVAKAQDRVDKLMMPPGIKKRLQKMVFKDEDTPVWGRLGFEDLHRWRCNKATKHWSMVGKLLNHPLMRVGLDICIIIKLDLEKARLMLSNTYGLELSDEAVHLYMHYFGNFDNFTKTDWQEYLERLVEDQYVYTRIFAALTKPKDEVLHLCGLPSEKQFSDFLKNVLATASYKFNHYSRQNTVEADSVAMDWAKIGIVSGEKFEKFGAGDISDFAKLVQTEFEYITSPIDTLSPEMAQNIRPDLKELDAPKAK